MSVHYRCEHVLKTGEKCKRWSIGTSRCSMHRLKTVAEEYVEEKERLEREKLEKSRND